MNIKLLAIVSLITTSFLFNSVTAQKVSETIQIYIKGNGIDSISKADLLQEKYFKFNQEGITVAHAEVYFDKGESFKNVQMQSTAGNSLDFLRLYSIIKAKTPFRMTVAFIRYEDKNGNNGFLKEFSFVVY
ncbi:MAG: hypothetical protein ABIP95_02625 [Pelobium sp.]